MHATINFFNENTVFELRDKTRIRKWLERCARSEKKRIGTLNYIFCNDRYLRSINKKYLNHDYNTDIITFSTSDSTDKTINGDIYISINRVKENAVTYGARISEELHRVMVHGLLHLSGYNDKTKNEQNKMRQLENRYLVKLNNS